MKKENKDAVHMILRALTILSVVVLAWGIYSAGTAIGEGLAQAQVTMVANMTVEELDSTLTLVMSEDVTVLTNMTIVQEAAEVAE